MTDHQSMISNRVNTVFADMEAPDHPGGAVLVMGQHAIAFKRG